MLNLSRFCRSASVVPHIKRVVVGPSKNIAQNVATYQTLIFKRQILFNSLKVKLMQPKHKNNTDSLGELETKLAHFVRGTETVAGELRDVSNKSRKAVGYWLLTCSGMMFAGVVLEGVTRLTNSGLSMATWKLCGGKMPRTEAEWEEEHTKYQQKNKDIITLSQFKFNWYLEYGQQQLSKAIGAVFLIPAVYFWIKGRFARGIKKRVLIFGTLMIAQCLTGWYVMKSVNEGESDAPKVSQYRLAGHLSLTYLLYTFFLWSGLYHIFPAEAVSFTSREALKASKKLRWLVHMSKGLIFFTAVSGVYVTALNAGLVYNSFPKMADKWIPDDILAFKPKFINFTENPTTVQFDHRVLGTTTLGFITYLWYLSRKRVLPPRAYKAATVLVCLAYLQVSLGIATLLTYVPTSLAASHQAGSLTLLSAAIWLAHELKNLPK